MLVGLRADLSTSEPRGGRRSIIERERVMLPRSRGDGGKVTGDT